MCNPNFYDERIFFEDDVEALIKKIGIEPTDIGWTHGCLFVEGIDIDEAHNIVGALRAFTGCEVDLSEFPPTEREPLAEFAFDIGEVDNNV